MTYRVPFGPQSIIATGNVSQRDILRRAIDLAQPELTDDPAEAWADIAAAERMFTLPRTRDPRGFEYVVVDEGTFVRADRLIAEAIEYAVENGYGGDGDDATDRLLGSVGADLNIARLTREVAR